METFRQIGEFFDHPVFNIIGGITLIITVIAIIYKIICVVVGITPVVFRLGIGLWRRRIAIFGSADFCSSIQTTLIDSKIFKAKNICHVQADNIDKAKTETIFLVDWESFGMHIDQVFTSRKNQNTAIVIFAKPASIPPEKMPEIANRANTVVVNFRGRLLNDILTSLITTSYDK